MIRLWNRTVGKQDKHATLSALVLIGGEISVEDFQDLDDIGSLAVGGFSAGRLRARADQPADLIAAPDR
jgi:hypothetical protein